jgi:hypothetical protein
VWGQIGKALADLAVSEGFLLLMGLSAVLMGLSELLIGLS